MRGISMPPTKPTLPVRVARPASAPTKKLPSFSRNTTVITLGSWYGLRRAVIERLAAGAPSVGARADLGALGSGPAPPGGMARGQTNDDCHGFRRGSHGRYLTRMGRRVKRPPRGALVTKGPGIEPRRRK